MVDGQQTDGQTEGRNSPLITTLVHLHPKGQGGSNRVFALPPNELLEAETDESVAVTHTLRIGTTLIPRPFILENEAISPFTSAPQFRI